MSEYFTLSVAIILFSGFIAGVVCKRLKTSPLIGYLIVGAIIGPGCLDLTNANAYKNAMQSEQDRVEFAEKSRENAQKLAEEAKERRQQEKAENCRQTAPLVQQNLELRREVAELEQELSNQKSRTEAALLTGDTFQIYSSEELAKMTEGRAALEGATEFGVQLLLFSIGIEFTFAQLTATAKYMFVGGALQMGCTIGLAILICMLFHMPWTAGLALGSVVALSSTALVYKSLGDLGQADTKRAQATLGMLIFQDIALVPLLLVLPIVLGCGSEEEVQYWFGNPWIDMTLKSAAFCIIVVLLKVMNYTTVIPRLAALRSNDLVILFAIVVLVGMCLVAEALGLTPALGALAAGVVLGENRLTHQIDSLVLPFREAFSAMFFISLGMLTDFGYVFQHPLTCLLALLGAIAFKAMCATLALRVCGMDRRGALAYGVSISQIGELAFTLLAVAYAAGAINDASYNTMLFVSVGSLVVTPNLVKLAMTRFGMPPETKEVSKADADVSPELFRAITNAKGHSIIVGAGPIGSSLASTLVAAKRSVCLIDFNPVNLQPFNQNGTPTVTGDGADHEILRRAGIGRAELVFVTVPRDDLAVAIVKSARALNPTAVVAVRVRYRMNVALVRRAGAELVLCEENTIADEMVRLLVAHLKGEDEPEDAAAPAAL